MKPLPCPHGDATCPCQDGDSCHYKDTPARDGWPSTKAAMCPHCACECGHRAEDHDDRLRCAHEECTCPEYNPGHTESLEDA